MNTTFWLNKIMDTMYTSAIGEWVENTSVSFVASASEPASPSDGDYWYDTTNSVLKEYSETGTQWNTASQTITYNASAPTNPTNNQWWYSTSDSKLYYWSLGEMEFWVGLSSTLPTQAGGNISEPSTGAYTRVKVTAFSSPVNGMVKNTAAIEFPRSTAVWFDSDHKAAYWLLFDGSGAGAHLLSSGLLDEAKTVESNTTITIAAETLSITLTDYVSAS